MDDHPHACWDLSKSFNSPDKGREPGVNENGVLATYAPTPPMRVCTSTPISRSVVLAASVACSASAASCSDTASNLHCSVLSIMRRASVYHVFIHIVTPPLVCWDINHF